MTTFIVTDRFYGLPVARTTNEAEAEAFAIDGSVDVCDASATGTGYQIKLLRNRTIGFFYWAVLKDGKTISEHVAVEAARDKLRALLAASVPATDPDGWIF